jgi:crotonobetainyl-CoA:carnitine CoA-transferase CaiB-like acyl-CoA transferase
VPDGGQHGLHALYRLYPCASGWIFLAAVQDKEWPALAARLEHPEWCDDPRFATREARLDHDDELVALLSDVFDTRDADEWQDSFLGSGIAVARADAQTFEEFLVANTPHRPMTHPDFGDYWRRPPVIRIDGCEAAAPDTAPRVGEHTTLLLAELGFTAEERAALEEAGVVMAREHG